MHRPLAASLALISLLAFGCSSNPTAREVVDRSTPITCDKIKQCSGDAAFAAAFPNGTSECVEKTKAQVSQKFGGDLDKSSVCDDAQLTKCLDDFKAAACKANGQPPDVPCDC